ncbi:MAG TPA: porin family protein [Patescibacteria group bacterium]|nr:porin family protein [Patescibacteria group bacterium]
MIKSIVLAVALFGLCTLHSPVEAQVSFGIKGGYTQSTFDDDLRSTQEDLRTNDPAHGFAGGIFANFSLPFLPLSIQPEVLYVQKGNHLKYSSTANLPHEHLDVETTLQYIEVPVLAKLKVPLTLPFMPHIFAGPTYSYLLHSEERTQSQHVGITQDTTLSPVPRFGTSDLGIAFGLGIDFELLVTKISLEARHTTGLMNIYKKESDTSPELTFKNRTWMFMLGVAF